MLTEQSGLWYNARPRATDCCAAGAANPRTAGFPLIDPASQTCSRNTLLRRLGVSITADDDVFKREYYSIYQQAMAVRR